MQNLWELTPVEAIRAYRQAELDEARAAPKLLNDRAGADGNVRLAYAGRFAFELLQNACDAHDRQLDLSEQGRCAAPSKARAKVILTDTHLLVANTGYPFSFEPLGPDGASGIEALCRYGASNKGPSRRAYKGQFGIGFKSVDEVADEVLISSNGYRLRFDRERLRRALGADAHKKLPLLYAPEWFDEGPDEIAELEADGFATVIALTLGDAGDLQDIRDRLAEVGPSEVLLLETLACLHIDDRSTGGTLARRYTLERVEQGPAERWCVRLNGKEHPFALFRAAIGAGPQEHRIAWPMSAEDEVLPHLGGRFMTFYPISGEPCGAPFIVHSYFTLDSNRKTFAAHPQDRRRNEQLMAGVLDLLERSLPALRSLSRGGATLHELVWPAPTAAPDETAAAFFHDALRARAWSWPIFESRDGHCRAGGQVWWPARGLGLDEALEGAEVSDPPFVRRPDHIWPRPEAHAALEPEHVAAWLARTPPRLPGPRAFARLLLVLDELTKDAREAFSELAASARVLPVARGEDVAWTGQSDLTQVFLAAGPVLTIDPGLDAVLQIRLLHPDALNEGSRGSAAAARELFRVRELAPDDLVRGLERAVEGKRPDTSAALAILKTVVSALRPRLVALAAERDLVEPWYFSHHQSTPAARTRIALSTLPIPMRTGPPVTAGRLSLEDTAGRLARLYPPDSGQRFLNEETEHPDARRLLDSIRPEGTVGWRFRQKVYAYLGLWPMPRLDAFYGGQNGVSADESPHAAIERRTWRRYLRDAKGQRSLNNARVQRSICWPDFEAQAAWCAANGRLPELLVEVQRHRATLCSGRTAQLRVGSGNRYPVPILHWQLLNVRWLPAIMDGQVGTAVTADEAWWTRDVLDEAHLVGSQWNHLPTLHAGICERWLAETLGLSDYDRSSAPDPKVSKGRTIKALELITERAKTHDGQGLRKLYRRLTKRLDQLGGGAGDLKTVLAVTRSGPAQEVAPADAWVEDLPRPLPLGRGELCITLFGSGTRRLATALGVRSLRDADIRYHAHDQGEQSQEETSLTYALGRLIPIAFAIRAHSRRIDLHQRLDLSKKENLRLIGRALVAVVEVVEGVSIFVGSDEQPLAIQGPGEPVVVAHEPDAERGTLPVYLSKRQVRAAQHEVRRLLPLLAPVAAALAGDANIADALELLVREDGDLDDSAVEAFLSRRHQITRSELDAVRRKCGVTPVEREVLRSQAREQSRWEAWRSRSAALCRPLLARLTTLGGHHTPEQVAGRLEGHRDDASPLDGARQSFAAQDVSVDDPLWAITTGPEATAFLAAHPALEQALNSAMSAAEAATAQQDEAEKATDYARGFLLAFAFAQAPTMRLGGVLAQWAIICSALDLTGPEPVRDAAAALLDWLGVEGDERDAVLTPSGRWWAEEHLAAMGLTAADIVQMQFDISRHEQSERAVIDKRELAYAEWIRRHGHHERVVPTRVALEQRDPPESLTDGAPVMSLQLESRGSTRKHAKQNRRNALTGGLGEVFALLQEVEVWRALPTPHLDGLLSEVETLFGGDANAQTHVATVRRTARDSEVWEASLQSLLRIGDLKGARCDLLGARVTEHGAALVFLEVKSTSAGRLDRFYLSSAEWSFLSRADVRDRSALVLVSRAVAGGVPMVEILDNPASLVQARKLGMEASTFEVRPHRRAAGTTGSR